VKQHRLLAPLWRTRAWIKPEVRAGLDGFAALFAVTLFFCLLQSAHDGVVNRNRTFDPQRWWYPIYQIFYSDNL